jgi:flagellar hook-basal body complex protein FliE
MKLNPILTQLPPITGGVLKTTVETPIESFGNLLNHQLQKVDQAQTKADELSQKLVSGTEVELHDVLIAAEEAKLMLEMTVQIRNKVIEAYKEMMNMQL